jgi:hypothetical protein
MNSEIDWILNYKWEIMSTTEQLTTLKDSLNEIICQVNWITKRLKELK